MKAIKLRVDFSTGKRAGGINPRGKKYPLSPEWQNIEGGWEVRLVTEAEACKFEGIDGIEILDGLEAIDAETCKCCKTEYAIWNDALMVESIRQTGINLSDLGNTLEPKEIIIKLYDMGVAGIHKHTSQHLKAEEMGKRHGIDT